MDICDIFNRYSSDIPVTSYLQIYHVLFNHRREREINILEIGIKSSETLRAWNDYFPQSHVIGINIIDPSECNKVSEFVKEHGSFDLIIDNYGNSNDVDTLKTLRYFYPHLNSGGIYIIEGIPQDSTFIKHPALIGCGCNHDPYFFVGLKNSQCVINKSHINSQRLYY